MEEKEKVTLVIHGSLISSGQIVGGGIFANARDSSENYDTGDAIHIGGDLHVSAFDAGSNVVLVDGDVVTKEKGGVHVS